MLNVKHSGTIQSGFSIGSYPITFAFKIYDSASRRSVEVQALLPANYPDTPLKRAFGDRIATVSLAIDRQKITVLFLRVYSSSRTYVDIDRRPLPDEIQGSKGLGKSILCFGIYQAWVYFNSLFTLSDLVIDLETGATHFYDDSEWDALIQQTSHLSSNDMIIEIVNADPIADPIADPVELYVKLRSKSDKDLRELYVEHIENRKLAKYYQTTYGFKPVPQEDVYIEDSTIIMEAPVTTVFQHCALEIQQ